MAAATTSRRAGVPDRLTVVIATVAAFLALLALLAWQFRSTPAVRPRPVVVLRKVYETRVIGNGSGPSTVSQSGSGSGSLGGAPATRSS